MTVSDSVPDEGLVRVMGTRALSLSIVNMVIGAGLSLFCGDWEPDYTQRILLLFKKGTGELVCALMDEYMKFIEPGDYNIRTTLKTEEIMANCNLIRQHPQRHLSCRLI